jgi:hypothetical protein
MFEVDATGHRWHVGRSCRGGAFVELALVLPVLLTIFLAALEFSIFVRQRNSVQLFVRDVALEVYKRCEGSAPGTPTQQCLQTESGPFYQQLSGRFPERHRMIIQVFRVSVPYSASNPCPLDASFQRTGLPLGGSTSSRVLTGPGTTVGSLCSGGGVTSNAHRTMMSVEVLYRYDPVVVAMARFFSFEDDVQYVAAVI